MSKKQDIDLGGLTEEFNGVMNGLCDNYETAVKLNVNAGLISFYWRGQVGDGSMAFGKHVSLSKISQAFHPVSVLNYEIDSLKDDVATALKDI